MLVNETKRSLISFFCSSTSNGTPDHFIGVSRDWLTTVYCNLCKLQRSPHFNEFIGELNPGYRRSNHVWYLSSPVFIFLIFREQVCLAVTLQLYRMESWISLEQVTTTLHIILAIMDIIWTQNLQLKDAQLRRDGVALLLGAVSCFIVLYLSSCVHICT